MRRALIFCLTLTGLLDAQSGEFGAWPGVATWSSRNGVDGARTGEVLLRLGGSHMRGFGHSGTSAESDVAGCDAGVDGVRVIVQDEEAASQERFAVVLRSENNVGRPDSKLPLAEITGIRLPLARPGPAAFIVTVGLDRPSAVPATETTFVGVRLTASPLWPEDGMSVHTAHYSTGESGDNPSPNAPDLVHTLSTLPRLQLRTPRSRTIAAFLLTPRPVLTVGSRIRAEARRGPDPCWGVAGWYPDGARQDGLALRLRDGNGPGRLVSVFVSFDLGEAIHAPGIDGPIWLHLDSAFLLATDRADTNGHVELLFDPVRAHDPAHGLLTFQAVSWTLDDPVDDLDHVPVEGAEPRMSNLAVRCR